MAIKTAVIVCQPFRMSIFETPCNFVNSLFLDANQKKTLTKEDPTSITSKIDVSKIALH